MRTERRKKRRARLATRLLVLVSLALTAALVWRWWTVPAPPDSLRTAVPIPAQTLKGPDARPRPEHEEINTVERQALEDILRQKNTTGRR
jgi:hypothetical protein